jgi:hypothetical protein
MKKLLIVFTVSLLLTAVPMLLGAEARDFSSASVPR